MRCGFQTKDGSRPWSYPQGSTGQTPIGRCPKRSGSSGRTVGPDLLCRSDLLGLRRFSSRRKFRQTSLQVKSLVVALERLVVHLEGIERTENDPIAKFNRDPLFSGHRLLDAESDFVVVTPFEVEVPFERP